MKRTPRKHEPDHLAFVRQLPCIACGDNTATEACHIRYADRSVAKRPTGMAEKPDDVFAVPLCGRCHRQQHSMNERSFWIMQNIDPIKIALAIWHRRGDANACAMIVANPRRER